MYFVYMIGCEGDLLYTGIAADIEKRLSEHFTRSEKCAKFTRAHRARSVEAVWTVPDKSTALRLEWRIKQLTKQKKLALIASPENVSALLDETAEITVYRELDESKFKDLTTVL